VDGEHDLVAFGDPLAEKIFVLREWLWAKSRLAVAATPASPVNPHLKSRIFFIENNSGKPLG
jgi:hypothetical protein